MKPKLLPPVLLGLATIAGTGSANAQVFYGPTPYLSAADSPFASLAGFSYFHLEDFRDATFTPGWSANPNWVQGNGSPYTDSVDADDGAIDGSGVNGGSFYSGNANFTLTITFDVGTLGELPTHVGLVWTDVGNVVGDRPATNIAAAGPGFGGVTIQAWGPGDSFLGSFDAGVLGDGSALSATAEDRFLGISFAGGITRFEMTMANSFDWEVDHLQYGALRANGAVPEPATTGLLAAGALGALVALRRVRAAKSRA